MQNSHSEIGIEKMGNKTRLYVENIECGGCGNTITKSLTALGFEQVIVDPDNNTVDFISPNTESDITKALDKLKSLGYPLVNTEEGLNALLSKAKSFASCAIGKVSN